MASIDPSMFSYPEGQNWVVEISKILHQQLRINTETPSVSLFQVPETIAKTKPEAYEPQQIGLGPIHHFHPRLYNKMEQKKLGVMRKVLQDNEAKELVRFVNIFKKVMSLVPIVRSCYDMFLQCDDNHLACLLAIDGLFLLNLFYTYNDHPEPTEVGPKKRSVAQDIMMVENQIPFIVLKEIHEALYSTSCSSSHSSSYFLTCSIFKTFCKIHSPLKLCSDSIGPSRADHLLHYMYYKIVNNVRRVEKPPEQPQPQPKPQPQPQEGEKLRQQDKNILEETFLILERIPKNEIVEAYEQTISILESFCQSDQHVIPSASTLHDKGGFKFHGMEEDFGIKNIRISGTDVYLPVVTLNKDSDVILRNLVAYEALTSKSNSFPLIEYMVLMCALVVNVDDVKRLKNVIEGDLEAEEVVKLFTGMSGCLPATKMEEKSKMKGVIDEINKVYNSGLRMRAYKLLEKFAQWLLMVLRAIGGFVGSSWKIAAFILSLVTVVLLTLQAYRDVYGCGNKKS